MELPRFSTPPALGVMLAAASPATSMLLRAAEPVVHEPPVAVAEDGLVHTESCPRRPHVHRRHIRRDRHPTLTTTG